MKDKKDGENKTSILIKTSGPDYNNCLVNLSNSILRRFGAETTANTLGVADDFFAKNYKNSYEKSI